MKLPVPNITKYCTYYYKPQSMPADREARKQQVVVGERSRIKALPAWFYLFHLLDGHRSLKALRAIEIYYEFRICFLVWKGELTTIMNQQVQMECP